MNVRRRRLKYAGIASAVAIFVAATLFDPSAGVSAHTHDRPSSFERGRRDRQNIALTFDGGSDAREGELILDVLEQRGVSATFFLTGDFISRYPALVRRIAAAGHEVGNHTWSHPHLTEWNRTHRHRTLPGLDRSTIAQELNRTARAFEEAAGRPMAALWRAPFGEVNDELLLWASEAGWSHVGWTRDDSGGRHTLDSLDWISERSARGYLTSEQITSRILSFGAGGTGLNGGIVLMHVGTRREDPAVTRLGSLIDALRAEGYRLVTVTELQRDALPPGLPLPLTASLAGKNE